MLAIRDRFSVTCFLETGTYEGDTASWAANHFDEVVTIEASPELHQRALEKSPSLSNVRFVLRGLTFAPGSRVGRLTTRDCLA